MKNQKKLVEEWLKKYDIVGNKAWWDGETYYNLRVEQICSIIRYINSKKNNNNHKLNQSL